MSFKADNTTGKLLTHNNNTNLNKYNKCGVYQLTCQDCNKKYIGQTRRPFTQDFKSISETLHVKMENKNSHIHTYVRTYTHTHTCIYIYIYIHIYTYTYTYIHTYIHTNIYCRPEHVQCNC